jgi:hypothetical protein
MATLDARLRIRGPSVSPSPTVRHPATLPAAGVVTGLVVVVVAGLLAATALAGCGGDSGAQSGATRPIAMERVAPATLAPGEPVPVPVGPPVLTLSGRIGTTNVGDTLQFDLATLERLGLVGYRVDDRLAEGRVASFRGVLLERVLAMAAPDRGTTRLQAHALNDYEVSIPLGDVRSYPVLVASSIDGARMPVDKYGPIRVMYPYGAYGLKPPVADEKLIWQLDRIEVR